MYTILRRFVNTLSTRVQYHYKSVLLLVRKLWLLIILYIKSINTKDIHVHVWLDTPTQEWATNVPKITDICHTIEYRRHEREHIHIGKGTYTGNNDHIIIMDIYKYIYTKVFSHSWLPQN